MVLLLRGSGPVREVLLDIWNNVAIVGIGSTEFSTNSGRSEFQLALEACRAACDDAGLDPKEVDGVSRYSADSNWEYTVAQALGAKNLRFQAATSVGGNVGPGGSTMLAAMGVATGLCKYAIAFRALNERSGHRFGQSAAGARVVSGSGDMAHMVPFGFVVPGQWAAVRARRHMHEYGTESRHFGMISVAARKHANRNPMAFFRDRTMTLEDHQTSRMVADPLHLFDYCLESDGAAAVLLTTADRAKDLKQPPAYVMSGAWGGAPAMSGMFGYSSYPIHEEPAVSNMAKDLFGRAGLTPKDIKVAQIYDHFTPLVLFSLESLGFCKVGEGASFVENGRLEWPDGELVLNSSGGHLSEGYLHGMNLVVEAVRQARGTSTCQVETDTSLFMSALSPSNQSNVGFILRR